MLTYFVHENQKVGVFLLFSLRQSLHCVTPGYDTFVRGLLTILKKEITKKIFAKKCGFTYFEMHTA